MNKQVNLTRRIDKRHYPLVWNSNGTIKPDVVKIDDVPTRMTGGTFYVSWYRGRQLQYRSVGTDPGRATNLRFALMAAIEKGELPDWAKGTGETVSAAQSAPTAEPSDIPVDAKETVAHAVKRYEDHWLKRIGREKGDRKTWGSYGVTCRYFLEFVPRACLQDVTAENMLSFSDFLADYKWKTGKRKGKRKLGARSVANRFNEVMIFLNWAKHRIDIPAEGRPAYTDKEVEIYDPEMMEEFWSACTYEQNLKFRFFLQSGLRDQEFAHLGRNDLLRATSMVRVTAKPQYRWKPKKGNERSVPVPPELIDEVLAYVPQKPYDRLLFPNTLGRPDSSLLEKLKDIARKAGIHDRFYLHKFRATYATTMLADGTDIETVRKWMGHKDLKAIQRYLKAIGGVRAKERVESAWGPRGIWANLPKAPTQPNEP